MKTRNFTRIWALYGWSLEIYKALIVTVMRRQRQPSRKESVLWDPPESTSYLSKLWLDKIEGEFELLVFDHHTDMQMPMFGNILSCGGWIQAALDTNTRLKRVYLAGPPSMEAEADRERVVGINEEELKTPGCISRHLKDSELPLYISLDKDILTRSCAITNWDQGEAQLEDVLACIKEAASCRSIIGVDVCGENPDDQEQEGNRASQTNQSTNREIVCKLLEICDVLCP